MSHISIHQFQTETPLQPYRVNLFAAGEERHLLHSFLVHSSGILVLRSGRFDAILPAAAQGPVEGDDGQELVGPVLG